MPGILLLSFVSSVGPLLPTAPTGKMSCKLLQVVLIRLSARQLENGQIIIICFLTVNFDGYGRNGPKEPVLLTIHDGNDSISPSQSPERASI